MVVIRLRMRIPDQFSTSVTVAEWMILRDIVAVLTGRFSRHSAKRQTPTNLQRLESDPVDIRMRIRINAEIWIRTSDHFQLSLGLGKGICPMSTVQLLRLLLLLLRETECVL